MGGMTSRQFEFNATITALVGQLMVGGVVSTTVTVWRQVLVSPQPSANSQVRVMTCGQTPLVTVPVTVMSKLVLVPGTLLVQQVEAEGASNVQVLPHCTVSLVGHCTCKQ